jgi:mannitol 2-dehydrogenase
MADPLIRDWLIALEEREVVPTLSPIHGVDYTEYQALIVDRFSNPEVGDTIPRLCLDGSNRQPKFILPTLADALEKGLAMEGLALETALWCRYCAGVDEAGNEIAPNDDNHAELKARALEAKDRPQAFLENTTVFGTLGQNAQYAEAFAKHLTALWNEGVTPVLTRYIAG